MKKFKRLSALFLALVMICAVCVVPASAARNYKPTPTALPNTFHAPISSGYAVNSTNVIDNVVNIVGTPIFTESGVGAHYYAFSRYTDTYKSAFVNVKLPTGLDGQGYRNAYISLGIMGDHHGIDLGIKNEGNGWYPYSADTYYEGGGRFVDYDNYMAPSTATNAIITVKPIDTDTVYLHVHWLNSAGNEVGTSFTREIDVLPGNMLISQYTGNLVCRFYRFASLVPLPGEYDDQSDGSYMTGGKFMNCQLYNGSSYVNWPGNASPTDRAWKVSTDKITVNFSGINDTFNINHS
jgi:hypothetical protein